jgi:hypothetical protein
VDSCSRTTGSARTFVLFSASALHERVIDGGCMGATELAPEIVSDTRPMS